MCCRNLLFISGTAFVFLLSRWNMQTAWMPVLRGKMGGGRGGTLTLCCEGPEINLTPGGLAVGSRGQLSDRAAELLYLFFTSSLETHSQTMHQWGQSQGWPLSSGRYFQPGLSCCVLGWATAPAALLKYHWPSSDLQTDISGWPPLGPTTMGLLSYHWAVSDLVTVTETDPDPDLLTHFPHLTRLITTDSFGNLDSAAPGCPPHWGLVGQALASEAPALQAQGPSLGLESLSLREQLAIALSWQLFFVYMCISVLTEIHKCFLLSKFCLI